MAANILFVLALVASGACISHSMMADEDSESGGRGVTQ